MDMKIWSTAITYIDDQVGEVILRGNLSTLIIFLNLKLNSTLHFWSLYIISHLEKFYVCIHYNKNKLSVMLNVLRINKY